MKPIVLDSSVVLAVLNEEGDWESFKPLLRQGLISAVNLSEVVARLIERRISPADIDEILGELALPTEPFDVDDARASGVLRGPTRAFGLSFGDRACLALGRRVDGTVYTADRAWSGVDVGVEIVVVR
jgi:PIN domain nuclease of toxin-antitoxin system